MSTEDFQVQDIYRYSRKSFKKHRINTTQNFSAIRRENNTNLDTPRSTVSANEVESPRCSCDDSEGEIANILHKKCPVIALAQQQLQKILNGTDKLLCENPRCCRSIFDFLCVCKETILKEKTCQCVLMIFVFISFFLGLLAGAASCGTYLRKFNSPILSCIDNYFTTEKYHKQDDTFRGIV